MAADSPQDELLGEPLAMDVVDELRSIDPDGAWLVELVSTFQKDAEERIEALGAAIDSGNHTDAERLAHSVTGASRTVGAVRVAKVAQKIRLAGRAQDAATARSLLPALTHELTVAIGALHRVLGK
jgi:HPt (histidine-containing phosphotransfer) domain-containing protein